MATPPLLKEIYLQTNSISLSWAFNCLSTRIFTLDKGFKIYKNAYIAMFDKTVLLKNLV